MSHGDGRGRISFFAPVSFVGQPGLGCYCGNVLTASSGTIQTRNSPIVCGMAPGTWPLRNQVATVLYGFLILRANIHESLTPEQALDRVVEYYRAWGANQPGGRR